MKMVKTYSPGKCILTGEHSVVYEQPALATALDQGVWVTLVDEKFDQQQSYAEFHKHVFDIFYQETDQSPADINAYVQWQIPVGSGMGASAAVAHALFKALFDWYEIEYTAQQLFELVQRSERLAHSNPSGVDAATVINGSLTLFQKQNQHYQIEPVRSQLPWSVKFVLIQSGIPDESTAEMVEYVAARITADQQQEAVISDLGATSQEIIDLFVSPDKLLVREEQAWSSRFKQLLFDNHELLVKLGVVGDHAQKMIAQIVQAGGVAKISGAGGKKSGSGILLAFHEDMEKLRWLIDENEWEFFHLKVEGMSS